MLNTKRKMKKKNFINHILMVIAGLVICLTSCNNETDGGPDPEGTAIANITKGTYYNSGINVGGGGGIYISESINFHETPGVGWSDVLFYDFGKVKGLADVDKIVESGWSGGVAVLVNHGYLLKIINYYYPSDISYGRLYVTKFLENTNGGIIGAQVKLQYPFVP